MDRVVTELAPLALGSAQWGQRYGVANRTGRPNISEVGHILSLGKGADIRTIDTARAYGESEAVIGRLTFNDPHWTIITKVAPNVDDEGLTKDEVIGRVAASILMSQRLLQRSKLDGLLLHRASHRTVFDGAVWRFLRGRQMDGDVGLLGVSASSPAEAFDALQDDSIALIQVATSLLDQRLVRSDFFERARERGKRVHLRSVFLQGVSHLRQGELPAHLDALRQPLQAVEASATEVGASVSDLFLWFARSLPVDAVIIGCENAQQLALNIRATTRPLSLDFIASLAARVPNLGNEVLDPFRWANTS